MAFSGFREYMAVKRRKLEIQGQEVAVAGNQSSVLNGLTLYFNGYTGGELTMIQFKELVLVHGALVRDKLEPDVTHIIATQITDSKMKQLRKPVVRPNWLLDSISGQKLLPWNSYRLYTNTVSSQKTLGNFTAQTPQSTPQAEQLCDHMEMGSAKVAEADIDDEIREEVFEENEDDSWFGPNPAVVDMNSKWVKENVSTAPGFVKRYFSSSRLHHLSTWKSDLRDFVALHGPKLRPNRTTNGQRTICHVDMDSFFASVAIRDQPYLRNLPVAVAHSTGISGRSTSELASCNYIARSFGIRNGMSIGRARELCKDLQVVPYEFEKYDTISKELYLILLRHADQVQAVSCDEAYIDVSSAITQAGQGQELALASQIRQEIQETTSCPASIGVGPNMLLARMATKRAKPDGAFYVSQEDAPEFIQSQLVKDLPGVGWVLAKQLTEKNITTCEDLADLSMATLQKEYGVKTGMMLYNACRGIDDRRLENKARQSVGAEINWGIRFAAEDEVANFFRDLSEEVERRMKAASVQGKQLTVKVKRKRYEGEPAKVLGCGNCDNLSKSMHASQATDSAEFIFREGYRLLLDLQVPVTDIRGIGLHISKLEGGLLPQAPVRESGQTILKFTVPSPKKEPKKDLHQLVNKPRERTNSIAGYGVNADNIDWDVLKELPEDIRKELMPLVKSRDVRRNRKEQRLLVASPPSSSHTKEELLPARIEMRHALPTASQVDPDVLKALPNSIQKEIEAAMKRADPSTRAMTAAGARGTAKARPKNVVGHEKGQVRFDGLPELSEGASPPRLPQPPPKPALGGQSDMVSVRKMLDDWVKAYRDGPEADDVAVVEGYLGNLVDEMELESVDILCRWFKSRVGVDKGSKGKGNAGWTAVAKRLMQNVNEKVKLKYGSELKDKK